MSDDTRPDAANNATISTGSEESTPPEQVTPETTENASESKMDTNADESAGDTFPRTYVEDLRKENADYRKKAKAAEERADTLAKRLHSELVKATGKLENAADLDFDAGHLDDADTLAAAIDALLQDRPYLKARKVSGDVGQGQRGGVDNVVSLLDILRSRV